MRVNILQWASRVALDIISLAGFNYDLDTLHQNVDGSELATQIHRLSNPGRLQLIVFFKMFARPLRWVTFDRQSRDARQMQATMRKIGVEMIEQTQRELALEEASRKEGTTTHEPSEHDLGCGHVTTTH